MDTPQKWLNHNSQWKTGRGVTERTNDINTTYTPREGNQPRVNGNQLIGNKQDSEHLETKQSLHLSI